jgi:hypothetical protein
MDDDFEKILKIMTKRHDVVALGLEDPRELELAQLGLVELKDSETGERIILDTDSAAVRATFKANAAARVDRNLKLFKSSKVDYIRIATDQPYIDSLQQFFQRRERRFR